VRGFLQRVGAIARKETRHLLRDPRTLIIVFFQPVMLMALYGYCFNFDLRELPFIVLDHDKTAASRRLVQQLNPGGKTPSFVLVGYIDDLVEVEPLLASGKARFALVIPRGYGQDVSAGKRASVQALFDAAESNVAGVTMGYLGGAVSLYNATLSTDSGSRQRGAHRYGAASSRSPLAGAQRIDTTSAGTIDLRWRVLYNPDLSSIRFVIPGLVGILLTFVASSLTSVTIVRERELGPMESLLTAPVSPTEIVLGKMAPYILVGAGNIVLVLMIGGFVFGIWPRGDLLTLASFSFLFLVGVLAVGMVVSARVRTQQVALTMAALLTLLPNLFLTGFIFPRSNMPPIIQGITFVLPATQYLIAIRGIFLKGTGWEVHWPQGLLLALIGAGLTLLTIRLVRSSMARGLE
jgi:ABC-2 type transport system permease protein